jgi:hypothetical protein
MVCKMKLNDSFWKHFELDLQEIKLAYLNWAIGYAKEPKPNIDTCFNGTIRIVSVSSIADMVVLSVLVLLVLELEGCRDQSIKAFHAD